MKRIISIIMVICMLLCGCAAGTSNKEPKALSELGEGKREESVAIVKVTINPEFELYLDGALCITKVRCLNEDAVTAFETMQTGGASVISLRYEEAMPVILDGIASAGFLNENTDKIQVNITLLMEFPEAEMAAMSEMFSAPVTYYTTEHELNAEVLAPAPVLADDAKKVAWAGQAPNANDGQNNGAVMGTPSSELAFTIYENDAVIGEGIRYFDENGILYKETSSYKNGTTQEVLYYENGKLKSDITNRPDGSIEQHFREDGTQSYYLEDTAEKYFEMAFYPNGNRESETFKQGETSITSTFYENGNMKSSICDGPDGYFEWHYDENGELTDYIDGGPAWNEGEPNSVVEYVEYFNSGEGVRTDYFDENGLLYKRIEVYADGTSYERTFYPSGDLRTTKTVDANGVCNSYGYNDESGTHIHNIGEPNLTVTYNTTGGVMTDYYDENGLLYKVCEVYYDGTSRVMLYDENGEMVADGFYDENGNIMDMRNSGT